MEAKDDLKCPHCNKSLDLPPIDQLAVKLGLKPPNEFFHDQLREHGSEQPRGRTTRQMLWALQLAMDGQSVVRVVQARRMALAQQATMAEWCRRLELSIEQDAGHSIRIYGPGGRSGWIKIVSADDAEKMMTGAHPPLARDVRILFDLAPVTY